MKSKEKNQVVKIDYFEDFLDVDTKNSVIGVVADFSTETFICKSKTGSKYYDRFRVCPESNIIQFLTKDDKIIDKYPIYDIIHVEPDIDYNSYKDLESYINNDKQYNPISCFNNSIDDFENSNLNNYYGDTEQFFTEAEYEK